MTDDPQADDETPEQRQHREYLDSIADLLSAMRPDHEIRELAKGCPDPDMFADDEGWDADLEAGQ